jgi:hypothetical protein
LLGRLRMLDFDPSSSPCDAKSSTLTESVKTNSLSFLRMLLGSS